MTSVSRILICCIFLTCLVGCGNNPCLVGGVEVTCSEAMQPTNFIIIDPPLQVETQEPGYIGIPPQTQGVPQQTPMTTSTVVGMQGINETPTLSATQTNEFIVHIDTIKSEATVCRSGTKIELKTPSGVTLNIFSLTPLEILDDYIDQIEKLGIDPIVLFEPGGVFLKTGQAQVAGGITYMGYLPDFNQASFNIDSISKFGNKFVYIKRSPSGGLEPQAQERILDPVFARQALEMQQAILESVVETLYNEPQFMNYVSSGILVFHADSGSTANGLAIKDISDSDIFIAANLPPGESPLIAINIADFFAKPEVQRKIAEKANVIDSGLSHISILIAIISNSDKQTVFDTLHIDIPLVREELYEDRPEGKYSSYNDCLGG